MVWLLAERGRRDGRRRLRAHRLAHAAAPRDRRGARRRRTHRGGGIGIAVCEALEGWAGEHGATELEGPVGEDDEGSLAWAAARGYKEVGRNSRLVLDLTAIEAPERARRRGSRSSPGPSGPSSPPGMYEVAREAVPDIPGEEEADVGTFEEWLERDMRGDSDGPSAVFVALENGEVPATRSSRF